MKNFARQQFKWLVLAIMISCFLPTHAQIKINNGTTVNVPSGTYMITSTNLTINTGGDIDIRGYASINGNLTNNAAAGGFTVESDGSGTGSLIVSGEAAGNITFERYADVYAKGQKWHYVSAPVSGQAITSAWMTANDIGFADPAWQFFRFSEPYNYWIYFDYEGGVPEPFGDESFVDARGYCLTRTSNGVLSFSGTLLTSNITYDATFTTGQGNGFNLVGNPFTSAIGVTSDAGTAGNFLAANTALLDDNYEALYIWDEAVDYTYGSQDYKVISNAVISGHTAIDQDFIAPGQAFMVKVVSGGGNLAFNTNMQAHNTAAAYKSKESWPSVELTVSGNGNSNSTAIGFHHEMTTGLDPSFDAAKFKGNPNLAFYTKLVDDNGKDFALQALPDGNIEDYVISIGVDVSESGIFEFTATQEKLDNYSILLEDRQQSTFTDLRWETYQTEISQSGTGRFYLHFKDATAIGEITPISNIQIWAAGGNIYIKNIGNGDGVVQTAHALSVPHITITDIMGRTIIHRQLPADNFITIPVNLETGVYVVVVQSGEEIKTEKVFIK